MCVQNRFYVIRDDVQPNRWFYFPMKINPANIAARITNSFKLVNDSLWWNVPNILIVDPLEISDQDILLQLGTLEERYCDGDSGR